MNDRLTLKQKLALPSPTWLLVVVMALVIIGIAKLLMWITPIVAAVVVKVVMWLAPIVWGLVAWLAVNVWQAIIWISAGVCAYLVWEWQVKKQRQLYRDISSGTMVFDVEYSIRDEL